MSHLFKTLFVFFIWVSTSSAQQISVQYDLSPEFGQYGDVSYRLFALPQTETPVTLQFGRDDTGIGPLMALVSRDGRVIFDPGSRYLEFHEPVPLTVPAGDWIVLVTTRDESVTGTVEIMTSHALRPLDPSAIPLESLFAAFEKMEHFNPEAEKTVMVQVFSNHLKQPNNRRFVRRDVFSLLQETGDDIAYHTETYENSAAETAPRIQALKQALTAVQSLSDSQEIVAEVLRKELQDTERKDRNALLALENALKTQQFLNALLDGLNEMDRLAAQLDALSEQDAMGEAGETLNRNLNSLATDIAQLVYDSQLSIGLTFGGILGGDDQFWTTAELQSPADILPAPVVGSEPPSIVTDVWGDTAFLTKDEILRASARASLDRVILEDAAQDSISKPTVDTLGDAADIMIDLLDRENFTELTFLGLKDSGAGFVLMTGLEQTNGKGKPLAGEQRFKTSIVKVKQPGLAGYLRALFTSEPGFFRVIAFMVTTEQLSNTGPKGKLETLLSWNDRGFKHLPPAVAAQPWSQGHTITVLVYEFAKQNENDPAEVLPKGFPVDAHLTEAPTIHPYVRG